MKQHWEELRLVGSGLFFSRSSESPTMGKSGVQEGQDTEHSKVPLGTYTVWEWFSVSELKFSCRSFLYRFPLISPLSAQTSITYDKEI